MEKIQPKRLFTDKMLVRLLIPLVIEQGLAILVGMCDGMMISSAGEAAISGVSLVDMINNVILTLMAALATGGAVVTSDRKVYERAAIFHDSGCAFRPYAGEFSEPFFMGTQMRSNEVSGAILRVQLKRMDGIIADLKKVKAKLSAAVAQMEKISEIPSHDIEGDLGSTFGIRFETEEAAAKFDELSKDTGLDGCLVANSGKHVYYRWDPIMKHLGAHCDAMNPYNLPQNQGLQMEYSHDMLPQTLDLLNRTYHINLHCDWTEEEIQTKIDDIRKVCAQL